MVILVCAWCKEKMKSDSEWEEIDQTALKAKDTIISHGICLLCYEVLQEDLQQPLAQIVPESTLPETKIA